MTTSNRRELEAADAVFAAEHAVQRGCRVVEEFQEVVTSALRILDDAELDSSKSRLSDRDAFYLEAAAEHLGRLQARCNEVPNLTTELDTHLGRASAAVDQACARLAEFDTNTSAMTADVEQLKPRVAILGEVISLARSIAHVASDQVQRARQASRELTAPSPLDPQPVERSLRAAGRHLERADEGVRLLENVVERAVRRAHESVGIATAISDTARERMDAHRDHPGGPPESNSPASGGPSR